MAKDFFRTFKLACGFGLAVVLIAVLCTAQWLGLFRSPVVIIRNESPVAVNNVVVSGTGFSEHVGTITSGGEITVSMHPDGDSFIRIKFTAGQKQFDSGDQEYIAGNGDRFTATIDRNLKVYIRP